MCSSTWQWYSHVPGVSSRHRTRKLSAGPIVWVSRGRAVRLQPPVAVDVEGVEVAPDREHVPLDDVADLRAEDGRVAHEGAAVDRVEAELRGEVDDELAVGRILVPPEDRERAVEAALDRLHHRRRVVVVRPHAPRAGPRLEPVGERLARLHVRARPGEARDVRAVRAEPVAHAVEVHRVRLVRHRVEVPEVDDEPVADARMEERALQPGFPGPFGHLLREVLRVLAVGDGAEDRLRRREALALDRVPLVRHDVPRHRDGRHPVLAHRAARRRAARGDRRDRARREQHEDRAGEGRERERPRPSGSRDSGHSGRSRRRITG